MNIGQAIGTCFGKYAVVEGRASRSEYWYWMLFSVLICAVLSTIFPLLGLIFALAIFFPSISVFVRRMHDTGRSGWWFFLSFIPLIGSIVLIIFAIQKGTEGDNRYGPSPLGITAS